MTHAPPPAPQPHALPHVPPKRILAVLGGTSADRAALVSALSLAERHGAALEVLTVVAPPPDLGTLARLSGQSRAHLLADLVDHRRSAVQAEVDHLALADPVPVHLRQGKTFIEVVRFVLAHRVDLVIKTADPLTGLGRLLFASTDQHLLRKCPCPVWLQTPDAPRQPRRVIAAVDVDGWDAEEPETLHALNRHVLDMARTMASLGDGEVTVLHAWEPVGEGMIWAFSQKGDPHAAAEAYVAETHQSRRAALDRLIADMPRRGPDATARFTPLLLRGAPEDVITAQCAGGHADLVVMGTVARTGFSGVFIGNTAENIINSLDCPVVAVKPPGFVSPLDPAAGQGA